MREDKFNDTIPQINLELMKEITKRQTSLIETYLHEFCKVNGIEETELKKHLAVATCPPDNSVMVVNADDMRDVKFGVRTIIHSENGKFLVSFDIFGEYLDCKDTYPETTQLIESLKNE